MEKGNRMDKREIAAKNYTEERRDQESDLPG